MTENYAVFKKFSDLSQAQELSSFLKQNKIDCKLVNNSPAIDITFSGNTLQNEVQLLLKQVDFDNANKLLEKQAENLLEQIGQDHYLFDFTNEELYDLIMKPDEWGAFDYKLAQKILKDRGQTVNDDLIRTLKKQRIADLAKPEQGQRPWIYIGYFLSIMGGIMGMFIGWYLWTYKKTLPNGQKVYAYSSSDQKQGRNIFIIGIFSFVLWIVFKLLIETSYYQ